MKPNNELADMSESKMISAMLLYLLNSIVAGSILLITFLFVDSLTGAVKDIALFIFFLVLWLATMRNGGVK